VATEPFVEVEEYPGNGKAQLPFGVIAHHQNVDRVAVNCSMKVECLATIQYRDRDTTRSPR